MLLYPYQYKTAAKKPLKRLIYTVNALFIDTQEFLQVLILRVNERDKARNQLGTM